MNMFKERNISYTDHGDTVSPESHLKKSNLNLNRYGILAFARNFPIYFLGLD